MLGVTADNLVLRREIGMDAFGRLRSGSPLYRVHGLMVGWLGLELGILAIGGWRVLLISLSTVICALVLGMYPWAARRAFQNLCIERDRGSLQQLWLTGIDPTELCEGKYYGLLAPLVEIRRYLMLAGALLFTACLKLFAAPWALLAVVLWATAINHVGHSAVLGTLAGLRWGLIGELRARDLIREWRLNPWPDHLLLNLRVGVMLAPALVFLLWLGAAAPIVLSAAFGLMLLMPFYVAVHLRTRHQRETERLKSMFSVLLNPEALDLPSETVFSAGRPSAVDPPHERPQPFGPGAS